jgi:hypothetical protein
LCAEFAVEVRELRGRILGGRTRRQLRAQPAEARGVARRHLGWCGQRLPFQRGELVRLQMSLAPFGMAVSVGVPNVGLNFDWLDR